MEDYRAGREIVRYELVTGQAVSFGRSAPMWYDNPVRSSLTWPKFFDE